MTFAFASLGGALAAGSVGALDASLLLYPVYYCVVNGAIALLIHRRRTVLADYSRRRMKMSYPPVLPVSKPSEW